MAESAKVIADRFEVIAQAARGGMSTVYRARDRRSGADVAVKVVAATDRDSRARFEREAKILAGLSHPRIVAYVDHGTTAAGKPFLAMEWVAGETLHTRLDREPLTVAESIELGREVADALGYAHARGIVHRDIKPTNLMLRDRELSRVAILDFGVARVSVPGGLTSTGALVGTPAYMAPEQARGERALDAAVDVFALGCVLYECLTRRRAFEGKHTLALIAKIVLWDPPRVRTIDPEVSVELDAAIAAMIAKDRRARPADGKIVAALLASLPRPASVVRRAASPAVAATIVRASAPTVTTRPRLRVASIVVATPPEGVEEAPPESSSIQTGELVAALELLGVRFELLRDGSVLAAFAGEATPNELVERAVACGRAIRRVAPDALIAVASGEIGEGEALAASAAALLEETVATLAKEAMAAAFAAVAAPERPRGAIRVDSRSADLLGDAIVRVKSACYVAGAA